MLESKREIGFEILINSVRDANVDWDDFYSPSTIKEVIDGVNSGRLNGEDYEIRYSILGGVYDLSRRDWAMREIYNHVGFLAKKQ